MCRVRDKHTPRKCNKHITRKWNKHIPRKWNKHRPRNFLPDSKDVFVRVENNSTKKLGK